VPDVFIDIALPSCAGRLEPPSCTKRASPYPCEKRASPQLIRRCDCNDNSSPVSRYRRLDCNLWGYSGLFRPCWREAGAPFQRAAAASIGKWTNWRGD